MPDKNPPIQRSIELAPLSREHHEGLLFAWKLKRGLELDVSQERIGAFVRWYWNHHLRVHFAREEAILVPYLLKNKALRNRLLEEHGAVRKLLQEVELAPAPDLVQKLAEILTDHIRFEERILFKHLEVSVTVEELSEIGRQTAEGVAVQEDWSDPFWARK